MYLLGSIDSIDRSDHDDYVAQNMNKNKILELLFTVRMIWRGLSNHFKHRWKRWNHPTRLVSVQLMNSNLEPLSPFHMKVTLALPGPLHIVSKWGLTIRVLTLRASFLDKSTNLLDIFIVL